MIKQDIESLLCVGYVLLVLGWCLGFHALEVCFKDFVDGSRRVGDVRPIARGCCMLVLSLKMFRICYLRYLAAAAGAACD